MMTQLGITTIIHVRNVSIMTQLGILHEVYYYNTCRHNVSIMTQTRYTTIIHVHNVSIMTQLGILI